MIGASPPTSDEPESLFPLLKLVRELPIHDHLREFACQTFRNGNRGSPTCRLVLDNSRTTNTSSRREPAVRAQMVISSSISLCSLLGGKDLSECVPPGPCHVNAYVLAHLFEARSIRSRVRGRRCAIYSHDIDGFAETAGLAENHAPGWFSEGVNSLENEGARDGEKIFERGA
ncbi:hypothetical protein BC826DRAFT_1028276 [Russula brevipes]|nr:hypothetical protein BC826DRAFT_1028276 [Russula brevipes]